MFSGTGSIAPGEGFERTYKATRGREKDDDWCSEDVGGPTERQKAKTYHTF